MLFPKNLKKQYTPEEFVELMNGAALTGGKLKIVKPKTGAALVGLNYVVFENYEDPRFAVSIACFYEKFNKVSAVKADVTDVSGFDEQLVDNAKYNAAARVGGRLGTAIMSAASGDSAKRKAAKALAKTTNKELVAFLAKNGL